MNTGERTPTPSVLPIPREHADAVTAPAGQRTASTSALSSTNAMSSRASAYHFGTFVLNPGSRLLMNGGQRVHIGARALDILTTLVERPGEFIPRERLLELVWPDTYVEETSLRVHVAALRKALGGADAKFIATIPGKGYAFVGQLVEPPMPHDSVAHAHGETRTELPVRLTRMIGRDASVEAVASSLLTQRFVTITGEGGVGKTTLSLAIGQQVAHEYPHGVAFVDLAAIDHPHEVIGAVGRAVGLPLPKRAPSQALCDVLRSQALLLVIDNCEHLVKETAALVSALVSSCPLLRVLATSREALRIDGEHIYRLESLACPPREALLTADKALRYESIQLLVERVSASTDGFVLTDADAEVAAELCRRLDGIPLAIELAAARVGFFGLNGLLSRLPDRLRLLTAGDRTVMPRHQTLRALYDWSYDLLDEDGKVAFARLAVFPGFFSLEFALTMIPKGDKAAALNTFLDLISKSLVSAELGGESRRYRLLDSARVYAAEKLTASGREAECRLLHVNYLVGTLEDANPKWERKSGKAWLRKYAPLAEDVSCAMDWLSQEPTKAIEFAKLTMASFQLAQQLSQLESHRLHMIRALRQLEQLRNPPEDLLLHLTSTVGLTLTLSSQGKDAVEAWTATARKQLEFHPTSTPLLYTACVVAVVYGDYPQVLKTGERLEAICESSGDHQGATIARRFQAQARHYLGDFQLSARLAQKVLAFPKPTLRSGRLLDAVDQRISIGILAARTQWLEGRSTEAEAAVEACIELAGQELDHAKRMVLALAAIPIAMWCEKFGLARARLDELRALNSRLSGPDFWDEWVVGYGNLLSPTGEPQDVRSDLLLDHLGAMATGMPDARVIRRAESGVAGWCAPEVFRIQGESLLAASPSNASQALDKVRRSLKMARERDMVRWELRAATSLGSMDLSLGLGGQAKHDLLSALFKVPPVTCDVDVNRAKTVLAKLQRRRMETSRT